MRILFVSDSFPYPPDSGTKLRDYNLIRQLSGRCELSLLAYTFSDKEEAGAAVMRQYCQPVETVRFRRQSKWQHLPGVVKCLLAGQPLANRFVYSSEFAAKLRRLTAQQHYDVVQIDCTPMAPYHACIEKKSGQLPETRTALVFIDVNSLKFRRQLRYERTANMRLRMLIDWLLMSRWEVRYAERFDLCVMMSALDAERVRRQNPRLNAVVIPNGVDICGKHPLPEAAEGADLLFVGTLAHSPWADAVRYFHECIFPLVRERVPQARMLIVGNAPPDIRELASENVIVTGWVDDVEPYYQQSALSVVPLRSSGGTRLKILESLAYGRPVVSTSVGCEGLDLRPGSDLLVADNPAEFASQVIRALTDSALWQSLRHDGRRTVEQQYGWDTIADRLLAAYEQISCSQKTT